MLGVTKPLALQVNCCAALGAPEEDRSTAKLQNHRRIQLGKDL